MLPAITFSPIPLFTGLLSPVIKDSSRCARPFTITPSTEILSPGLLTTISFLCTSSIVTFLN